jgi:hypothetical protein
MDEYLAETVEHHGVTIKIIGDPDPSSPREWDNLGTMFCARNNRYSLGDESFDLDDFESVQDHHDHLREEYGATVILPLFLLDHSGLSMRTGDFNDPWDSGQVGWICDTREGRERIGFELDRFGRDEDVATRIKEILEGEVRTYSQYLEGDVYGYVIEDEDGCTRDSCWGYYGTEDAIEEGKSAAEYVAKELREERDEEMAELAAASITYAWTPSS